TLLAKLDAMTGSKPTPAPEPEEGPATSGSGAGMGSEAPDEGAPLPDEDDLHDRTEEPREGGTASDLLEDADDEDLPEGKGGGSRDEPEDAALEEELSEEDPLEEEDEEGA